LAPMHGMPMASNIRVILKKNFRAQSCDGWPVVKKGGLILAIRVS
jgi:hypothetical protein